MQSFADQIKHTILSDTCTQHRNVPPTENKYESKKNSEKIADDKFSRDTKATLQKEQYQKPEISSTHPQFIPHYTHPVPRLNVKSKTNSEKRADDKFRREPEDTLQKER